MKELTDLDRALLAVIRQCTLIDDVKDEKTDGYRKEAVLRAEMLIALSETVLKRVWEE